MIRMTHPTIGTQVDVDEDAVEAWASVGWLRPEPDPAEAEADDGPAELAHGSASAAAPPPPEPLATT